MWVFFRNIQQTLGKFHAIDVDKLCLINTQGKQATFDKTNKFLDSVGRFLDITPETFKTVSQQERFLPLTWLMYILKYIYSGLSPDMSYIISFSYNLIVYFMKEQKSLIYYHDCLRQSCKIYSILTPYLM